MLRDATHAAVFDSRMHIDARQPIDRAFGARDAAAESATRSRIEDGDLTSRPVPRWRIALPKLCSHPISLPFITVTPADCTRRVPRETRSHDRDHRWRVEWDVRVAFVWSGRGPSHRPGVLYIVLWRALLRVLAGLGMSIRYTRCRHAGWTEAIRSPRQHLASSRRWWIALGSGVMMLTVRGLGDGRAMAIKRPHRRTAWKRKAIDYDWSTIHSSAGRSVSM